MAIAPGAVVALVCLLAPSGGQVDEAPHGAEVDDAGFVGPVQLVATDDSESRRRWNVAPRLEPGSPAWFQVRSWSVERGRLTILAQSHTLGHAPGLPSLRVDQVETAMGLAWQPRRSSWLSLFVALRATSSAVRGDEGAEVRAGVGLMAGLRIMLPSLVDVVRKWRAR